MAPTEIAKRLLVSLDRTDDNADSPAKTSLDWATVNLWLVSMTSGMEDSCKYRTAQLNATQREKKNTTGSVNSKSAFKSAQLIK